MKKFKPYLIIAAVVVAVLAIIYRVPKARTAIIGQ
jgi:hypothetical protein